MGNSVSSTGPGSETSKIRGVEKGRLSRLWCRSRRTATLTDATSASIYTLRDMVDRCRGVTKLLIVQHMTKRKRFRRLRPLVKSSDNCGQDYLDRHRDPEYKGRSRGSPDVDRHGSAREEGSSSFCVSATSRYTSSTH
jgi:hypothetical protein